MDELIQNLKRSGVLQSPYVEAAFRVIDRKNFVTAEYQREAYGDYPLPIGSGQTISQPYTVAFMLDLLDPRPGERILDVGAGSGWQTCLLAHIVSAKDKSQRTKGEGRVYALERIPELCALARENIGKYSFLAKQVVELSCTDATGDLPGAAYDKIIAAAAAAGDIPASWRDALAEGGVIVAPVGESVRRYRKLTGERWEEASFPGFAFVPLIGEKGARAENEKRMEPAARQWRRKTFTLGTALAFIVLSAAAFAPHRLAPGKIRVEIPEGAGSRDAARILANAGIVRSKWLFVAYAALTGQAESLKAGAYEFAGQVTMPAVVGKLVRGGTYPNERLITIPEGWDLRDIAAYFEELGVASAEELWRVTGRPAAIPARGKALDLVQDKPAAVTLEGYLYPDTYRIFLDAPVEVVVRKMTENFAHKFTADLRAEIKRQGRTVHEVVTLASLLEQEVRTPQDRRLVAGILRRRLEAGIPLQVDASVNYATGKRETPSAGDLAADSPYNTYRIRGLPPGPISNPGQEAIAAALDPAPTDYLYYLSAPDGLTVFSRTLAEHAAAKARYLQH